MPKKISAGILLYRRRGGDLEFFLVHPGGPFWAKKDLGAWSIPKGEIADAEDPRSAAIREFTEETGFAVDGEMLPLTPIRQAGGKTVYSWAVEGDCDPSALRSNTFMLYGRQYPEVDRAGWFTLEEARRKILGGQEPLLGECAAVVSRSPSG